MRLQGVMSPNANVSFSSMTLPDCAVFLPRIVNEATGIGKAAFSCFIRRAAPCQFVMPTKITCFVGVAALPQRKRIFRGQHRRLVARTELPLLPFERSFLTCVPSPTTVTFFRGRVGAARPELARRVRSILEANPWLSSEISPGRDGILSARYDTGAFLDSHFTVRYDLNIPRNGRFCDLARGIDVARVAPAAVGRYPLWRVTLVPLGSAMYGVVVSGAHALTDAHTHYAVQRMVLGGSPVRALNPIRKADKFRLQQEFSWEPPGVLLQALTTFSGVVVGYGSAGPMRAYEVDSRWLRTRRAELRAQGAVVSSNDILLHELSLCNGGEPYSSMRLPIDLRLGRRVDGLDVDDVGNYVDTLGLEPDDFTTPQAVRRKVSSWQMSETMIQSEADSNSGRSTHIAVVSNWTLFASSASSLPGAEPVLHLPAILNPIWPELVFFVLFRTSPGKMGVAVYAKQKVLASVRASKMICRELNIPTSPVTPPKPER